MRTSLSQKSRPLFMEVLESRYALDASACGDPSSTDQPTNDPTTNDPPAEFAGGETDPSASCSTDPPPDPGTDPGTDPSSNPPPDPPPPYQLLDSELCLDQDCTQGVATTALTPDAELAVYQNALSQAIYLYQLDMGNTNQVLGLGWPGNICLPFQENSPGQPCNEVHDGIQKYANTIADNLFNQMGAAPVNYDMATVFANGFLPGFDLTNHAYLGIVNQETGALEYFSDPWASSEYFTFRPEGYDPNWNIDRITPWNTQAMPYPDDPNPYDPWSSDTWFSI